MADQSQTLPLCISEALHKRLDLLRELMSTRKGEAVSTYVVAKQLPQSARLDHAELTELVNRPTETCWKFAASARPTIPHLANQTALLHDAI
jgi:hypothetical protein